MGIGRIGVRQQIHPSLLFSLRLILISTRPFRKSYPDVLVMQPSQDRNGNNGARPHND